MKATHFLYIIIFCSCILFVSCEDSEPIGGYTPIDFVLIDNPENVNMKCTDKSKAVYEVAVPEGGAEFTLQMTNHSGPEISNISVMINSSKDPGLKYTIATLDVIFSGYTIYNEDGSMQVITDWAEFYLERGDNLKCKILPFDDDFGDYNIRLIEVPVYAATEGYSKVTFSQHILK